MPPSSLTRYQVTLIAAAVIAAVAIGLDNAWLVTGVVVGFLVLLGLGVTLPQFSFFGPFICRGKTNQRLVALTFDDGPDARSTPALLDYLRERKVPATFFCIGKHVVDNGELTNRILREGHLLGNHTYNHSNSTNFFDEKRVHEEMLRTQKVIEAATGTAPRWFRPPMGYSNPRVFRASYRLHLSVIGWTARGFDTRVTDPDRVVSRILRQLKPGGIILLHDGNIPTERLLKTVKLLLDRLHTLGYEVVRLDELLK